jgi:hypothetical protein
MAFVTKAFRETQGELIWEFDWDGVADFTPFTEDRKYWTTTAQIAQQPQPNGSSLITGLDLSARHKEGPHLDDNNPGGPVTFRLDPVKILQDFGSSEVDRGSQQAAHAPHFDTYQLKTFRLYGQPKVALKLLGTHTSAPPATVGTPPAAGVTATPPTTVTTPGAPGTPAAATPRPGTCKKFTFVEIPHDDNGYVWVSGAIRFGEVDVGSVKDMVDHILSHLGEDECIGELVIIGHGAPGNISVGNGMSGSDSGKEISTTNVSAWLPELLRLRCKFCEDSVVYLRGCNVGAGDQGAELLHLIRDALRCAKSVQAPTGKCYPANTTGQTQTAPRDETQPPAPLPNPDEPQKSAGSGSKFPLIFGRNPASIVRMEALSIVDARYLPRVLGRPFEAALLEKSALPLPGSLVSALRAWLPSASLADGALAGFSLDGYLQLAVREKGKTVWQPPWGVMGGGAYLSPLRENTNILFSLAGSPAAKRLERFVTEAKFGRE